MAAAEPLEETAADPMVVVDNLHVVYRVFGSRSDKGTAATALWRMLRRQRRPSVREVHAIRGVSFVANRGDAVRLVDEALVTGEAEFRVRSRQRIEELRAQAGTVFIVAHSMAQIEETCNRVIWLEKGQIVRAGDDVPTIIDAYLAATGGEPLVREPAKT